MSICKCTMLLQVLWVIDYVLILGIIPIPEVQGKMGIELLPVFHRQPDTCRYGI